MSSGFPIGTYSKGKYNVMQTFTRNQLTGLDYTLQSMNQNAVQYVTKMCYIPMASHFLDIIIKASIIAWD